jgi:Fur family iron response transcriptional regulator
MKNIIQQLSLHGISPTHQRVEIAQVLFSKAQHVSAEQVLALVNNGHTVSSKATVYNTLGLFARKGLLREVIIDPTKIFYDTNTTPHYHFYNEDTGTLEDIDTTKLDINELPDPPEGTKTETVDVIIRVKNKSESNNN